MKAAFPAACAVALLALAGTYANHFRNGFHFDDAHTVENNLFVRDLRNVPRFFRDARTFSSLPSNQSYRPLVTTTLALDYRLGGGLSPLAFHVDNFACFAAQVLLLATLFRRVLERAAGGGDARFAAIAGAMIFGLHPAVAETVNYVISRTDLLSTLGVVAALSLYAACPRARRLHLYLAPAILGMLAKESAAMFAPLLFLYLGLIEDQRSLAEILSPRALRALFARTLPSFVACGAMLALAMKMAPTWVPGGTSRLGYLRTQPFVVLHYFFAFLLPVNLHADSDWTVLTNPFDDRLLAGLSFLAALCAAAALCAKERATRPIAFGLLWFLVALAPTSSVVPFSEVMNDHRLYFPFVGLALAAAQVVVLLRERLRQRVARAALPPALLVLLACEAAGTRERNRVWRSEESLWRDVTRKSPQNARGWMNYGLARMEAGDLRAAEESFERALTLAPRYGYAEVNLAIALAATGRDAEAEAHFRAGVEDQPDVPALHRFFARFLADHGRDGEALEELRRAIRLAPADLASREQLLSLLARRSAWQELTQAAESTLEIDPGNALALRSRELARAIAGGRRPLDPGGLARPEPLAPPRGPR